MSASHGVSQRTMGIRRLRRALRQRGSLRASVQRIAPVSDPSLATSGAGGRTVVVMLIASIKPRPLWRGLQQARGRGKHVYVWRVMLGTHVHRRGGGESTRRRLACPASGQSECARTGRALRLVWGQSGERASDLRIHGKALSSRWPALALDLRAGAGRANTSEPLGVRLGWWLLEQQGKPKHQHPDALICRHSLPTTRPALQLCAHIDTSLLSAFASRRRKQPSSYTAPSTQHTLTPPTQPTPCRRRPHKTTTICVASRAQRLPSLPSHPSASQCALPASETAMAP